MSPRKPIQQELTRKMIMNAANELFATKGYQHVSMRQIAKELDCSHGAIYYHFKNKAELFFALVEDHFKLLDTKLEEILQQELEPKEKIKRIFLGYMEFGLTYQNHYEIMFLTKEDEVKDCFNQEPVQTYYNFAQGVHSLCENKVSIQDIWSVFLSLHGFVTHYSREGVGFEEVKSLAESHSNFLLKSII